MYSEQSLPDSIDLQLKIQDYHPFSTDQASEQQLNKQCQIQSSISEQQSSIMSIENNLQNQQLYIRNFIQQKYVKCFGFPKIYISIDKCCFNEIQTQNLELRYARQKDIIILHQQIFNNQQMMKLYGIGQNISIQSVTKKINGWEERLKINNPYSGMIINHKNSKKLLGFIVLGHSNFDQKAQLAFSFINPQIASKYSFQAVGVIILFYSQVLKRKGYLINNNQPFNYIIAYCRNQDTQKIQVASKLGCKVIQQTCRKGAKRNRYEIDMKQI